MSQTATADDLKTKKSALKWVDTYFGAAVAELEHIKSDDEDAVEILNIIHELKRAHIKILHMRATIQNAEASQITNLQEVNLAQEKLQESTKKTAEEDTKGAGAETEEV